MTSRALRVALVVAVVAALQIAAVLVYRAVERSRRPPRSFAADRVARRQTVAAFEAVRADGTPVSVAWPSDRVRVVHFWGTWCKPCRGELPGLLALGRQLHGRGVDVVAVAVDDDWESIRAFFDGAIPPEIVMMRDDGAHKAWGVSTLPDSYLVSRDGELEERFHGARDWRDGAAREHLERFAR